MFQITYKNQFFPISKSLAVFIQKELPKVPFETIDNATVFFVDNTFISLIDCVPTSSSSHFYIVLSTKKFRTTRALFEFFSVRYKLRIVDLFSGTGSSLLATQKFNSFQHVFANDLCPNSKAIFSENFDYTLFNPVDIKKISIDLIPSHDILLAGFPCQPFSKLGLQKGLNDPRSDVFNSILMIMKLKKPRFVFLENVKNLKSIQKGSIFKFYIDSLASLGYHVKTQVLNVSLLTGIPQRRERLFFFCFLQQSDYNNFSLEFKKKTNKNITAFLDKNVPSKYYFTTKSKRFILFNNSVINHVNSGSLYHHNWSKVRLYNNICPTLITHNPPLLRDDFGVRKLTPRECFRLQGFPDTYKLVGSDTTLYKLCGNAICVKIWELIFDNINSIYSQF